jgi:hypothetical protein
MPEICALEQELQAFFNNHHDKLLCTANKRGEPSVSLMGTPRITPHGTVDFEISDPVSMTLNNVRENKAVMFMAYVPGQRARDYFGVRIYAEVTEILSDGEKFEHIRQAVFARHGAEKADELEATISCSIARVRPGVDRGQQWNQSPFDDE